MRTSAAAPAFLIALSALVSLPAAAHDPDLAPAEALGNPPGLGAIQFKGPVGTPIENTVCPAIPDADRPIYEDGGTGHLGHINGVTGTAGTPLHYILPGTIDLWHFENAQYQSPGAMEGPHDVTNSAYSVMLGSDGFFRGQMSATIAEGPGNELIITDVHTNRAYCIYGSPFHDGPFLFIDSTWNDGYFGTTSNLDLAVYYEDIFTAQWPGQPVTMTYVFLVASPYDDPPPPLPTVTVDFTCANLDPDDYDLAPGVTFLATGVASDGSAVTYSWDFGDGQSGSGANPTHVYGDDNDFAVTVTASIANGATDMATHTCTTRNRPPTAFFFCPVVEGPGAVTFATSSFDPEGPIATHAWDFGDSGTASGGQVTHAYNTAGNYTVTLTVQDADWNSPRPTRAVTTDTFSRVCEVPGPPNHPPVLGPPPRPSVPVGSSIRYTVYGTDPDGDWPLAYSAYSLPAGATFDPATRTFSWQPMRAGLYSGFVFRITDPGGLYDERRGTIVVYDETSDADTDGIPDNADNCPATANHDQTDAGHDGQGDACEDEPDPIAAAPVVRSNPDRAPDTDLDGVADASDSCPSVPNPDQADLDGDAVGDLCDADLDGDAVPNTAAAGAYLDNCPIDHNADQADADADGVGDACSWRPNPKDREELGLAPEPRGEPVPAPGTFSAAHAGLALGAMAATGLLVFLVLRRRLGDR